MQVPIAITLMMQREKESYLASLNPNIELNKARHERVVELLSEHRPFHLVDTCPYISASGNKMTTFLGVYD
jgi:hypothetical protein